MRRNADHTQSLTQRCGFTLDHQIVFNFDQATKMGIALDQETTMSKELEKISQSKSTFMKSHHIFGKKELKSRETSGMSVVESHTVISHVLQLESGLLLEVVYRYGSHYNFYNRRNKDEQ